MAALGFQIFPEWETLLLPESSINDNKDFNDDDDDDNVTKMLSNRHHHHWNNWNHNGENR